MQYNIYKNKLPKILKKLIVVIACKISWVFFSSFFKGFEYQAYRYLAAKSLSFLAMAWGGQLQMLGSVYKLTGESGPRDG